MNSYFYLIFIPYTLLALAGLVAATTNASILLLALVFWFFIGFLGVGVGFHKLFSHRAFETYKPIEYALAVFGTLSAYGPLLYWCANHQYHHKHADTLKDPTSPLHGFWHSAVTWNLKKSCETQFTLKNPPAKRILRDKTLMWLSKRFVPFNYTVLALTFSLSVEAGFALAIATLIERLRIGVVTSYLLHLPSTPGTYRNYPTKDWSRNSKWLLPLAWGFSFHNNHHARPGSANDAKGLFEIDPEYLVIKLIRKRRSQLQ